ncbi:MAG TPA: plastocyanin/azurin family copper-binding protein [Vicinamibacterales bacterium]|nr:plastocyanin/azurin family copper-binding protein [Vicinamibacterales bacterium]
MYVRSSVLLLLLVLAVACAQPASSPTSPAGAGGSLAAGGGPGLVLSATVQFGNDSVGSPFPPPSGHDQSGHGRDNLIPRTVVIDKGGTVTFKIVAPIHQVAIYRDGVEAADINTALVAPKAPCPAVYINDPTNRLAVLAEPPCKGGSSNPTYTFNTPGRYLVICTFVPHFAVGMYGWVEVRDRQ